jgi:hypothetical protein
MYSLSVFPANTARNPPHFTQYTPVPVYCSLPFCFRSCSMICLLQLCCCQIPWKLNVIYGVAFVLSAREESVLLRHLVAVFSVGTEPPGHADNADEDGAHDECVGFPVRGLRIPTTGRRPDVLGVPGSVNTGSKVPLGHVSYAIFPPPPIVNCVRAGIW